MLFVNCKLEVKSHVFVICFVILLIYKLYYYDYLICTESHD